MEEQHTVQDEIDALADVLDPWVRARQAHDLVARLADLSTEASRVRREALTELLATSNVRAVEIADWLGISRQRVTQLSQSGPRPERAFLGRGSQLLMVVGGKEEGGKATPGPVISTDDLGGYRMLSDAGRELGFDVQHEVVQPPGLVDLARDNLVVCCGPRLSPVIEQSLRSDQAIRFARDDSGWHLEDQATGTTYRSPMDSGENADYGYIARLPRTDGNGTYLYSSGIHAPGVSGGLHYMLSHLAELYDQMKLARFSAIVRCTFDPATRRILTSERVSELYQRGQGVAQ